MKSVYEFEFQNLMFCSFEVLKIFVLMRVLIVSFKCSELLMQFVGCWLLLCTIITISITS